MDGKKDLFEKLSAIYKFNVSRIGKIAKVTEAKVLIWELREEVGVNQAWLTKTSVSKSMEPATICYYMAKGLCRCHEIKTLR